jgi:NAD(P)-dependent dehydrogenase (short-subunit alcohol dehydrogenase family)
MGWFSSSPKKPKKVASKYYPAFTEELPDLTDQVICITGCTSGTGLVAAKTVASKGAAAVIMLNRASDRATAAEQAVKDVAADNCTVETVSCDLQSFESVKQAAATIQAKYPAVDVLMNNAGVMALDDYATTDGYDVQMQTNHLSHFLLTRELMPALTKASELRGSARVVNHSSLARLGKPFDAKYLEKKGGNLGGNGSFLFTGANWDRYHQSKLSNAVFTLGLADKLKAANSKVIATVAAPGFAATNLQTTSTGMGGVTMGIFNSFAQSGEDGTMPLLSASFLPCESGAFWEPSLWSKSVGPAKEYPLEKVCVDEVARKMLWEKSEEACGKFEV